MSLLGERMRAPTHQGPVEGATGVGAVGNPACGDVVTIQVRCADDRVEAVGFESMGSAYQLATASVLCDDVTGRTVPDAMCCTAERVLEALPDLPENKRYLARLAVEALHRALADQGRRAEGQESAGRHEMSPDDAQAFVLGLLDNGREWGTLEVDAMARADGLAYPGGPARFLAHLRADGVIAGEMKGRSWRWWRRASQDAEGGGHPGEQ